MTKKRSIKIIILLILLGIWFAGLVFFGKNGFFIINEKEQNVSKAPVKELMRGEKISGEFLSKQNYLSGLYIQFADAKRTEFEKQDNLIFRIKEKNSQKWIYENNYKSGAIKDYLNFPIGFSPIENSKNKAFVFEIVSLNGNNDNFVTASEDKSVSILYLFPKSSLKSPVNVTNFLILKLSNSFTNFDLLIRSLIFAIPLFVYVLYLLFGKERHLGKFHFLAVVILIAIDIVFISPLSYGLTAISFVFLLAVLLKFKENRLLLLTVIVVVVCWITLKLFGINFHDQKINIWLYLLLVSAAISMYFFEISQSRKRFTYKNVFEDESQLLREEFYKYVSLEKIIKDKTVLDLGCGYGPDSVNFSKYAKKVIGVDIERHTTWREIQNEKMKFIVAKSEKLPFKKNYFDAVYLKDLLHHVQSVDKTLEEINRVTKIGGKIIILEGNRYNPIFYFYATKLKGHEHFTQSKLKEIISRNFESFEIKQLNIYPPFFLKGKLYKYSLRIMLKTNKIGFLRSIFAYNIVVITQK